MEFRFNFYTGFFRLLKSITIFVILLFAYLYIAKYDIRETYKTAIIVILILYLPIIILFVQYLSNDYNSQIKFVRRDNKIIYKKGLSVSYIDFLEITFIECV